ncbi:hypothetical protein [Xanthobacter flavus]|uniref:hypothetical protein n=1 Tax=Xanthobacter flavus TaxID=281 RepID=UPI0037292DBD
MILISTLRSVPVAQSRLVVSAPRSAASLILLVIFLVGYHLRLSVYSGETILIPMYLCNVAVFIAIVNFYSKVNTGIYLYLSLLTAIIVLTTLVGAIDSDLSGMTGAIQTSLAIVGFVFLVFVLLDVEPGRMVRYFTALWIALIILATLERAAPVREIYDEITNIVYTGMPRSIYSADVRDMELYSIIRPKIFSSEPSYAATTLSTISLLILFAIGEARRLRNFAIYLGMQVVQYIVAPSQTSIFFVAAVALFIFWPKKVRLVHVVGAAMVIALVSILLLPSYSDILAGSSGDAPFSHQLTGSFFGRITAGPLLFMKVALTDPLFGVGVGNKNATADMIIDVWAEAGAFQKFPWYIGLRPQDLMSNGFWWSWVYLGIVGGIAFYLVLVLLLKRMGALHPGKVLMCTWVIWYAGSSFETIPSWFIMGIFAAWDIAGSRAQRVQSS